MLLRLIAEWRYNFSVDFGTQWRLSGQLHVSAALPPGKMPAASFLKMTGWAPDSVLKM
jgi:hypothetical protein